MGPHRLPLLLLTGLLACGDRSAPTPDTAEQATKKDAGAASGGADPSGLAPTPAGTTGAGTTAAGTTAAGTTAAGSTAAGTAATEAYPAPCKITWSDGRTLTFKHTPGGGTLTSDGDGDGSRDECGTFKTQDGRVSYLRIDEGCDRKTDATVRVREAGKIPGLLQAKVSRGGQTRTMTLVPLPSFGALLPGYLLDASPREVEVERDGGRITRVQAKAGDHARVLRLGYGEDGRLRTVDEDSNGDGKPEARFVYTRDAAGNVTRIATEAAGRVLTATLDYGCWAAAEATP